MNEVFTWINATWSSFSEGLRALIVLFLGGLGAIIARTLVSKFLLLVRFDKLSDKTGFSDFLRKGNAKYTPSRLVGTIAFWVALLAVFLLVANILDKDVYLAISEKVFGYLPNFFAGIFIAIVGSLVISFLANFVLTIALNASFPHARILAKIIKWLGIIVIVTVALEQMGLGMGIVEFISQMLIAAAAFGAALAFGLGCKDMARDLLQRVLQNLREKERSRQGSDLEG